MTALLVKVCAWALRQHPEVNASFRDDGVVEWDEVEEIAKITHLAMLKGEPLYLTRAQLAATGEMYQTVYGQG